MPQHYIEETLPYSQKQLFDLVADIENYPQFIPWCEAAKIIERNWAIVKKFADSDDKTMRVAGMKFPKEGWSNK